MSQDPLFTTRANCKPVVALSWTTLLRKEKAGKISPRVFPCDGLSAFVTETLKRELLRNVGIAA